MLSVIKLNVIVLNVIVLNVIVLNVVMLSVVGPQLLLLTQGEKMAINIETNREKIY
jgi:hypothetical protein